RRGSGRTADRRDPPVAHADRAGDGRCAGAVDDPLVGDEKIQRPRRRLLGGNQRGEARGGDESANEWFHVADYSGPQTSGLRLQISISLTRAPVLPRVRST